MGWISSNSNLPSFAQIMLTKFGPSSVLIALGFAKNFFFYFYIGIIIHEYMIIVSFASPYGYLHKTEEQLEEYYLDKRLAHNHGQNHGISSQSDNEEKDHH